MKNIFFMLYDSFMKSLETINFNFNLPIYLKFKSFELKINNSYYDKMTSRSTFFDCSLGIQVTTKQW